MGRVCATRQTIVAAVWPTSRRPINEGRGRRVARGGRQRLSLANNRLKLFTKNGIDLEARGGMGLQQSGGRGKQQTQKVQNEAKKRFRINKCLAGFSV